MLADESKTSSSHQSTTVSSISSPASVISHNNKFPSAVHSSNNSNSSGNSKVQVHFFSRQPKYANRCPQASVLVPTDLKRAALSEILHHLLGHTENTSSLFDIMIGGIMVRCTLSSFLEKHNISTENVIEIEFQDSMPKPSPTETFTHPDWVSCVNYHATADWLLSGCYDNDIRLWNGPNGLFKAGHSDTLKDIAWIPREKSSDAATNETSAFASSLLPNAKDGIDYFMSASQDKTLTLWRYNDKARTKVERISKAAVFEGHTSCVKSFGLAHSAPLMVSGSWDKTLKLWKIDDIDLTTCSPSSVDAMETDDAEEAKQPVVAKRKAKGKKKTMKVESDTAPVYHATTTLEGHTAPIQDTIWMPESSGSSSLVASAAWDHTVRLWDISTAQCTSILQGNYAANALAAHSHLLAVGYSDFHMSLFDVRECNKPASKFTMAQPTPWIYSISWSPFSPLHFVSGSADGGVRIWDIRSAVPLHILSLADAPLPAALSTKNDSPIDLELNLNNRGNPIKKALTVHWARKNTIFVGGENDAVLKYEIPNM